MQSRTAFGSAPCSAGKMIIAKQTCNSLNRSLASFVMTDLPNAFK